MSIKEEPTEASPTDHRALLLPRRLHPGISLDPHPNGPTNGPSFADSFPSQHQHQHQHDLSIAALAAEVGVSLPQWRDPVDDPNNAFGMAEMANLLPPIPQVHPNMLGAMQGGNLAGASTDAGPMSQGSVAALPPAQFHPSFAPHPAVRAVEHGMDESCTGPRRDKIGPGLRRTTEQPLGMSQADLEYLSALADFSDFSDPQGSAESSSSSVTSSTPSSPFRSRSNSAETAHFDPFRSRANSAETTVSFRSRSNSAETTVSAPSSAPGTPRSQKKAFRSRSNSAESLGTRPVRTAVTAPASSRKQIDSAYTAQDSRWPPEVLSGDVKAFNKWIKQANLTDDDQSELRRARRRHKNRIYAKRSRSKRRHRGASGGADDFDDTADNPSFSPEQQQHI